VIDPPDLQFDRVAGTLVIRLRGEIDLSNTPAIRRSIEDSISNEEHKVVVDLERVDYLDSAGIAMLFELWRRLAAREQRLFLVIPLESPVRRSLEVSGWPSDIAMAESLEKATAIQP
jgi:anti-sigma B factor antagonist